MPSAENHGLRLYTGDESVVTYAITCGNEVVEENDDLNMILEIAANLHQGCGKPWDLWCGRKQIGHVNRKGILVLICPLALAE